MKLKSIDINAFRLFDREHIDFTNIQQNGGQQCANFVTIYAPNGFGKTSLFDAIEFGMTRNIHRLKLGNFKEQMKYEGKVSTFASFIHNKKKPNENVSVKLVLEDFKEPVVEEVVEPDDEKNLLMGEGRNRFFTNAILSQDWFSEFLTAATAEDRFESFMRNFHQSGELLEYHSKLKTILKSIGIEKGGKHREINQLKNRLNKGLDEEIVNHLGDCLKTLADLGVALNWNGKVDEKSITQLKIETNGAEARTKSELKKNQAVLASCQKVKEGQEGLISLSNLEEKKQASLRLKTEIENNEKALGLIRQFKSLLEQRGKLEREKKTHCDELAKLKLLIEKYPYYCQQQETLTTRCDVLKAYVGQIKQLNEERSRIEGQTKNSESIKTSLETEFTAVSNRLEKLDEEYATYLSLIESISHSEKSLSKIELKLANNKADRDALKNKITLLVGIQKNVVDRTIQVVVEEYKEQSQEIITHQQNIKRKQGEIRQLEDGIRQKTNYQNQVNELVVRARGLVGELKDGVCPLCGYDYGSVDVLLNNIENNQAIATSIEKAMKMIVLLKKEIEGEWNKTDELYDALSSRLADDVKSVKSSMEEIEKVLRDLDITKAELQQSIVESRKKIENEYKLLDGLTKDQVRQQYEKNIDGLKEKIKVQENNLSLLRQKSGEFLKELTLAEEKRTAVLEEINKITNDKDYLDYKRILETEQTVDEYSFLIWKNKKNELEGIIKDYDAQLRDVEEALKNLKENNVDLTAEIPLSEEVSKLVNEKTIEEAAYFKTINYIALECGVKDITADTAVEAILEKVGKIWLDKETAISIAEKIQTKIVDLRSLIDSAEKYNQQQIIKREITKLEEEAKGLGNDQEKIKAEIGDLQTYLEKYVKNFFQLDLINELYNRIDPHPEYKEVKFDCDFSLNKPRLNVYMGTRKHGDPQIVPNLYFSTAQVNILAFCIFLAKAMFAKTDDGEDVGCIFIDDPIQALDDINILSMIDLLRNVAFKMKKQIVLTTHDQNFFGLLQKKIPQDKFNACYLEIYERGKFRNVDA